MVARTAWARRAAQLTHAKPGPLAQEPFAPQLASLVAEPPEGEAWIHEIKWDGYRLVGTVVDGKARLWSRNGLDWTAKVPTVAAALEALGVASLAVDGELIAGAGTQADFNALQRALSTAGRGRGVALALFDLVHLAGVDVARAPLLERKALLAELLAKPPACLAYSSHVPGDGAAAMALVAERGFEGVVSKRADAPYRGGRSSDWRKTKVLGSDEFAVVGFTPSKGSRVAFGSLLLARPTADGGWQYAGKVGTGFSDQLLRDLRKAMGNRGRAKPTVEIDAAKAKELQHGLWFPPLFVVEVFLRGKGASGILRQPSFKAVRPDKRVEDLRDADH